jgi:hypothetical protein
LTGARLGAKGIGAGAKLGVKGIGTGAKLGVKGTLAGAVGFADGFFWLALSRELLTPMMLLCPTIAFTYDDFRNLVSGGCFCGLTYRCCSFAFWYIHPPANH